MTLSVSAAEPCYGARTDASNRSMKVGAEKIMLKQIILDRDPIQSDWITV
jgi:hypothetical protein